METRTYEREKLYKEVWVEPMTTVAKRYGISDVALRKHCKKLGIPTPPNGYWAKVQAGQKPKIPNLPKSKGPDKIVTRNPSMNRSSSLSGIKNTETLSFLPEDHYQTVKGYCLSLVVSAELTHLHGLVRDTIQYLRSRKETTKPPLNRVLNIGVSDDQKDRAYKILSTLFKAVEHLGYSVDIKAPKAERYYNYERRVHDNVTYISLGVDGVPILIKELQQRVEHKPTKEELADQKRYSWARIPPYDLVKNGKLNFEIDEYHSKRKHWRDSDNKKIEDQIGEIIIWIMEAINIVKDRREKRETEEICRAEQERVRLESEKKRKEELEQLEIFENHASDWSRAEKIRKFAESIELKIADFESEQERAKIQNLLKWVRDKADWLDPLTRKQDEILGESALLFDLLGDDWIPEE